MKCLRCSSEDFLLQDVAHFPLVKNEIQEVIIATYICNKCGTYLLDDKQVNDLRQKSVDQYRIRHKLLSSREIVKYRKLFGMSQKAFAGYLSIGEASIKRWETYYIQDSSQDDHIRIKCDPMRAEENLLLVDQAHSIPDTFNGLKTFSFDSFKQMFLFFVQNTRSEKKQIPILYFYADFLNFKENNRSISGNRYMPFKTGPCPEKYASICKMLKKENAIQEVDNFFYPTKEVQMTAFNKSEAETLHLICDFCKNSKKCLIELAQCEKAYARAQDYCFLDYSYAKHLSIR